MVYNAQVNTFPLRYGTLCLVQVSGQFLYRFHACALAHGRCPVHPERIYKRLVGIRDEIHHETILQETE